LLFVIDYFLRIYLYYKNTATRVPWCHSQTGQLINIYHYLHIIYSLVMVNYRLGMDISCFIVKAVWFHCVYVCVHACVHVCVCAMYLCSGCIIVCISYGVRCFYMPEPWDFPVLDASYLSVIYGHISREMCMWNKYTVQLS